MKLILSLSVIFSLHFFTYSQTPTLKWGKMMVCSGFNSGFYRRIDKLVLNSEGGVYASGSFETENIEFDNVSYKNFSVDTVSSFLTKVDENGNVKWVKLIGGKRNDFINQIVTDASDNIYIYGTTNSNDLYLGDLKISGISKFYNNRGYLAKFDTNGNLLWYKILGNVFDFNASSMVIDQQGNVTVMGDYNDSEISFDQVTLKNKGDSRNTYDIAIVQYDQNGKQLSAIGMGGYFDETGFLAKDNQNNLILLVNSVDYKSFIFSNGSVLFNDAINNDYQFIVIDKDGTPLRSKYAGNSFNVSEMKFDTDNTLYIIGSALSQGSTINIQKFSPNLDKIHEKSFGGTRNEKGWSMVFDGKGNIYITGKFTDTTLGLTSKIEIKNIEYGSTDYPASDSFIIKLDTALTVNSGYRIASYFDDEGFALAFDGIKNNIYVAGATNSNNFYFGNNKSPYLLNNIDNSIGAFLFKFSFNAPTASLDELRILSRIFPNPTQESFSIITYNKLATSIKIYNSIGQVIFSEKLIENQLKVSTNNWNKGVYLIQQTDDLGNTVQVERLVVE